MGSPFGNEDSITTGVVSAIRRSIASLTSAYKVVDAIQIDAPITHGNSGGPLFDARGRVIGINAQIRTETGGAEGVGFAVPINAAQALDDAARRDGPGRLRVPGRDDGGSDADARAAPRLRRVAVRSSTRSRTAARPERRACAAAAAASRSTASRVTPGGDVIVAIDGRPVQSADDVVRDGRDAAPRADDQPHDRPGQGARRSCVAKARQPRPSSCRDEPVRLRNPAPGYEGAHGCMSAEATTCGDGWEPDRSADAFRPKPNTSRWCAWR